MVIAEAASVVTTLKGASELFEKIRNSDSKEVLRAQAAALTDMLLSARIAALDLIEQKALLVDERATLNERIKLLEIENRRLTDFGDRSEKFERIRTGSGQFVYCEKSAPTRNGGTPYFCPSCFLNAKASILQGRQGDTFHQCPVCRWGAFL